MPFKVFETERIGYVDFIVVFFDNSFKLFTI